MRGTTMFRAAALAAATLALGATVAAAQPARGRGPGGMEEELGPAARVLGAVARKLDLTREQKRSLRELIRQRGPELRAAVQDLADARRALGDLVLDEKADEAGIRAAAGRLGEQIAQASVLTARLAGEIRPILTPAQRERLRRLRESWERRREERADRYERWRERREARRERFEQRRERFDDRGGPLEGPGRDE